MEDTVSKQKYEFFPWEIEIRSRTAITRRKYKKFCWKRINTKHAKGWKVTIFGINIYYRHLRTTLGYRLWRENEKTKFKKI
jgi:hypothetical protein